MLPIFKRLLPAIAFLVVVTSVSAQRTTQFISGGFTEKTLAELHLMQFVNGKFLVYANYKITPGDGKFVFAIPADSNVSYRLQVNLLKPAGRHNKVDKIVSLPLSVKAGSNYTLKITPSKLSEAKKTGWELKQDPAKPSFAVISGNIVGTMARSALQVSLQSVKEGAMVSYSSVQSKADGSFEIACDVQQEGFYYLSSARWRVRVYLKPADRLQAEIDHMTGNIIALNGSRENQVLYQWQQLIRPITAYGYNLTIVNTDSIAMDEYIRRYEGLQTAMTGFSGSADNANPQFAKALMSVMDVDRQLVPLHFLLHKSAKKVKGFKPTPKDYNEVPAFYKQLIQPGKFSNASILLVGEARQLMNLYAKLNLALLSTEEKESLTQGEKLKLMMSTVSNDTLKSFFFNDQMEQMEVNNLSEFRETFEPFKKYAKASPAKETYKNIYALYVDDTAFIGKSSYNFTLPDTEGRMVSMKDFKGKVVLIDVWATWCGPCKAQFPFMKEIEHEYAANKDLVFVGISLDKAEVKQKWMDMIKKENLGGIQLLDDFGKTFGRKYGLTAIPRFMLIDRQGRWMEIRCPRPEAKKDLKRYLDKALAETGITKK